MIRAAFVALATLTALPAMAAGGVYCDAVTDKDVGAYLTVGRVPGFAVVGAKIVTKDRMWDMLELDGGAPVFPVQAAKVGDLIVADFSDPGAERIIASLRIVQTWAGDDQAAAGTLLLPGIGVWAVVCEVD